MKPYIILVEYLNDEVGQYAHSNRGMVGSGGLKNTYFKMWPKLLIVCGMSYFYGPLTIHHYALQLIWLKL